MVTKGWKTQPIRDFTAQVCKARVPDEADETQSKKGDIVGTAFAVSRKPPLLVTCRHVVEAATESDTCQLNDTVEICFPLAMYSGETITAKVTALDEAHNDDVVILELQTDDGLLPSKAEIAILGDARESIDYEPQHHFKSYGFPEIPDIIGNSAKGIMLDFTASADSDCGFELLQLDTKQVSGGMSGAAVLDTTRNLVVGVISMKLFTDYHQLRDNAYAVESMALTVSPLDLTFHEQWALEKETDPPPRSEVQSPLSYPLKPEFRPTQPPELAEWAGREAMLRALDADWASSATRVVGLIGYGGEGKSSIAYRWLTKYALPSEPDAAFWWSFYEDRSFETMLEALTTYLFGEALATKFKSPSARVEMVGEEIQKKRILLVLDGFEVVQHQQGDQFGEIVSSDLRRLLEIIAQPEHASLCVVTSRAPLIDLLNYDGYTERPVERLSAEDGRTLLRNLGVTGAEDAFDTIIKDWDGHALTVSLVGSYLVHTTQTADDYVTEGADKIFPEIEEYEGEVPRYKRVRRVLERYDKHLGKREKAFLKIFSVFRLPVATTAFDTVFRADTGSTLNAPLTELEDSAFANLITGLEKRRLIKRTERDDTTTYSAHPLVQRHYRTALEQSGDDVTPVHKRVAEHYDSTSDEPSRLPTLDDLKPYIEMVHHLCRAGAYDEAFDVTWNRIEQTNSFVLTKKLGADETSLNLMREFFPDNDENKDPQVSQQNIKAGILNEVGVCLMNLGRLREVEPFHIRKIQMALDAKNFQSACIGYQNLAELYEKLGDLAQMQTAAETALHEAEQVENERNQKRDERNSKTWLARAYHLQGYTTEASKTFAEAQALETKIDSDKQYLYSGRGIWYADHLRRIGDIQTARTITEANLIICRRNNWQHSWSQCERVLGDLAGDGGANNEARQHYDEALRLARNIDKLDILIQALLGRGRWLAYHRKDAVSAFNDLNEALGYAKDNYGIYEADIRVALAWAHLASGDVGQASAEAGRAMGASHQMGYHWGVVDAQEVFDALGD